MAKKYKVKAGDSFFSIAGRTTGDQRFFNLIQRANPGLKTLHAGMEIKIPDLDLKGKRDRSTGRVDTRSHYVSQGEMGRARERSRPAGASGQAAQPVIAAAPAVQQATAYQPVGSFPVSPYTGRQPFQQPQQLSSPYAPAQASTVGSTRPTRPGRPRGYQPQRPARTQPRRGPKVQPRPVAAEPPPPITPAQAEPRFVLPDRAKNSRPRRDRGARPGRGQPSAPSVPGLASPVAPGPASVARPTTTRAVQQLSSPENVVRRAANLQGAAQARELEGGLNYQKAADTYQVQRTQTRLVQNPDGSYEYIQVPTGEWANVPVKGTKPPSYLVHSPTGELAPFTGPDAHRMIGGGEGYPDLDVVPRRPDPVYTGPPGTPGTTAPPARPYQPRRGGGGGGGGGRRPRGGPGYGSYPPPPQNDPRLQRGGAGSYPGQPPRPDQVFRPAIMGLVSWRI